MPRSCRPRRRWLALLLALVLISGVRGPAGLAQTADPLVVQTADGPVRGTDHAGYRTFFGLPYAAPPVGDRRWQAPAPVTPWTELRDASVSGDACIPSISFSPAPDATPVPGTLPRSEDCLTLDLTLPAAATPATPRPVMVWIHGGAFAAGAGSDADAARLAVQGDAVVVAINYRLGALGFLNLPGLADGGGFGLLDQHAALRWVQTNIAAFGGDPANVTLVGESAGAISVCALLTDPAAAGLFQRGIIQSGPCNIHWPAGVLGAGLPAGAILVPPDTAATASAALALSLGCLPGGALDCLRAAAATAIQANPLAILASFPTIPSPALPADPRAQVAAGAYPPVPLIVGATRQELGGAGDPPAGPATAGALRARIAQSFGPATPAILAAYAGQAAADPGATWGAILTDSVFACPTWSLLNDLAPRAPVFAYEFADLAPPVPAGQPPATGAYHSSEVQYLLPARLAPPPLAPAQAALSDAMIAYWSSFAHTGVPTAIGLPVWPPFTPADPAVLSLAPGPAGIAPTDYAAAHHCAVWATILPAAAPGGLLPATSPATPAALATPVLAITDVGPHWLSPTNVTESGELAQ